MKYDKIILTGMPVCGKTTIGRQLADILQYRFIDMDEIIAIDAGMAIPEIFSQFGEAYFRQLENRAAVKLAKEQQAVIATGGGAVLNPANMEALSETGFVVFLHRTPEAILKNADLAGRPLLAGGRKEAEDKLFRLYQERLPLYKKYCSFEIDNDAGIKETIEAIKRKYDMLQ